MDPVLRFSAAKLWFLFLKYPDTCVFSSDTYNLKYIQIKQLEGVRFYLFLTPSNCLICIYLFYTLSGKKLKVTKEQLLIWNI